MVLEFAVLAVAHDAVFHVTVAHDRRHLTVLLGHFVDHGVARFATRRLAIETPTQRVDQTGLAGAIACRARICLVLALDEQQAAAVEFQLCFANREEILDR
ncbi:hypothetical protein D9M68_987880 [compost metagenome]